MAAAAGTSATQSGVSLEDKSKTNILIAPDADLSAAIDRVLSDMLLQYPDPPPAPCFTPQEMTVLNNGPRVGQTASTQKIIAAHDEKVKARQEAIKRRAANPVCGMRRFTRTNVARYLLTLGVEAYKLQQAKRK